MGIIYSINIFEEKNLRNFMKLYFFINNFKVFFMIHIRNFFLNKLTLLASNLFFNFQIKTILYRFIWIYYFSINTSTLILIIKPITFIPILRFHSWVDNFIFMIRLIKFFYHLPYPTKQYLFSFVLKCLFLILLIIFKILKFFLKFKTFLN